MVRNYAPSMGFADEHERPTTLERQDFHIPERWDYHSYRPKARLSFEEQADRHLPLKVSMEKPPKLNIVEFDGSPDRYPFFRAQVEEARQYHSDMKILAYLRTSLKGSAFESVRAVLLSGSSLDDILTVLRKHFGNPKVIVRNVTDRLFSRRVKNYEPAELAKYSVEVDNALAVLKAIGYEHELDNLIDTMDKLVSKLSSNDVDRWGEFGRRKESEGEIINFQLFAHFLSHLVEDRRFAALIISALDVNSRSKDKNPVKTKYLMTTSKKES